MLLNCLSFFLSIKLLISPSYLNEMLAVYSNLGVVFLFRHFKYVLPFSSEKAMAPHSSTLAWRIPGMGEPGELPSMGSHKVEHD